MTAGLLFPNDVHQFPIAVSLLGYLLGSGHFQDFPEQMESEIQGNRGLLRTFSSFRGLLLSAEWGGVGSVHHAANPEILLAEPLLRLELLHRPHKVTGRDVPDSAATQGGLVQVPQAEEVLFSHTE